MQTKATPPPPPPRRSKPAQLSPSQQSAPELNQEKQVQPLDTMAAANEVPIIPNNSGVQVAMNDASESHPSTSSSDHGRGSPRSIPSTDGPVQSIPASQDVQDMHGFIIRGSEDFLATYTGWQKTYSKKQTERGSRWSNIIKRSSSAYEKSATLKKLVRKGIPNCLRGRVWMEVSGATQLLAENPGVYLNLVGRAATEGRAEALGQIELDLHRTYPDHPRFNPAKAKGIDSQPASPSRSQAAPAAADMGPGGDGRAETPYVQALRRVLRAYSVRNSAVGYCQGMNFIAGAMLLFLEEESVFWLLAALLEHILPPDYYAHDLIGCTVDLRVFWELLAAKYSKVWKKLAAFNVGVEFFALEWFISLFSKTLPSETVLRIWDCIFFEGHKIIFRVALGVVGQSESHIAAAADQTDLLQLMQDVGRLQLDADTLLKSSFAIQLKRDVIEASRTRHRDDVERERRQRSLRSGTGSASE